MKSITFVSFIFLFGSVRMGNAQNSNVKTFEAVDTVYPSTVSFQLIDVVPDQGVSRLYIFTKSVDTSGTFGIPGAGILAVDSELVLQQRYFIRIPEHPYSSVTGMSAGVVDTAGHVFIGGEVHTTNRRYEGFLIKSHLLPNIDYMRLYAIPDTQYIGYDGTGVITALRALPGTSGYRLLAGGQFFYRSTYGGSPQYRAFVADVDPANGNLNWVVSNKSLPAPIYEILPHVAGGYTAWAYLGGVNPQIVVSRISNGGTLTTAPIKMQANNSNYQLIGVHPQAVTYASTYAAIQTLAIPGTSGGIWIVSTSQNFDQTYYSKLIQLESSASVPTDIYAVQSVSVIDSIGYILAFSQLGQAPPALIKFGIPSGHIHWARGIWTQMENISAGRLAVMNGRLYAVLNAGAKLQVVKMNLEGQFGDDCRDRIPLTMTIIDTIQPVFVNGAWSFDSTFPQATAVPYIETMTWIDSTLMPLPPSISDISFSPLLDSGCPNQALVISYANPHYSWLAADTAATVVAAGSGVSSSTYIGGFPPAGRPRTLHLMVYDRASLDYSFCIDSHTYHYSTPPTALNTGFTYSINNLTVSFQDTTTGATAWKWKFGTGDSAVGTPNPTYTYPSAGTYLVTLETMNHCTSIPWSAQQSITLTASGLGDETSMPMVKILPDGIQVSGRVDAIHAYSAAGREVGRCTHCHRLVLRDPRGYFLFRIVQDQRVIVRKVWF